MFLFEQPSIFVVAMSVATFAFLVFMGISEIMEKHLQYSKFWNVNSKKSSAKQQITLPSRTGMLILYSPAFVAGLGSFAFFPDGGIRLMMAKFAVTIHFLKRILEVRFVHKYSGGVILDSVILIAVSYFIAAAGIIYNQHLTEGIPEPAIDLKCIGVLLFLVGTCGNFYHHCLLAKLREKGENGYKIPKGGLFNLVLCPHYLFEILGLLGISFICQTVFSLTVAMGSAFYLLGRSYVTRRWYLSKFENFPQHVKALIPFVF